MTSVTTVLLTARIVKRRMSDIFPSPSVIQNARRHGAILETLDCSNPKSNKGVCGNVVDNGRSLHGPRSLFYVIFNNIFDDKLDSSVYARFYRYACLSFDFHIQSLVLPAFSALVRY